MAERLPGRLWFVSSLVLVLVLASASSAHAVTQDDEQVARKLYEEGKSAFDAGNYEAAYQAFRQAYLKLQKPELLFNMATALQRLARPHDAAETLRAFLRVRPNDPDAPAIDERIRALEEEQRLLDEDRRLHPPASPSAEPSPSPQPAVTQAPVAPDPAAVARAAEQARHGHRLWSAGIAVTAIGVASLVGGAVFVGLAKAANDDIDHAKVFNPATEDRRNTYERVDAVLFGIGGAAVVSGVTLLVVGHRESRVTVAPSLARGSAGVVARFAF